MKTTIRRSRNSDAPSLAECQREAARQSLQPIYGEEPISYWIERITAQKFLDTAEEIYVCEQQGEVVGFSSADLTEGVLGMWYVHPDHHGQGIGKLLLAKAEARLWEVGFTSISTYASQHAEPRFEKLGWRTEERVDRKLGPHLFPVAKMVKLRSEDLE